MSEIFAIIGASGSGKTTLIERLIAELTERGVRVSTIKHTHHDVPLDRKGKDSDRHRAAGATEAVLLSARGWALFHELRGAPRPRPEDLLARLSPVDLVLLEGFRRDRHPKLEVHRPALGKPLLGTGDPNLLAVASDRPVSGLSVPVLDLNDVPAVAEFIITHCRLPARR